ncbi:MAG: GGDEF domain-containing protein [Pseudomonadota bacterium]
MNRFFSLFSGIVPKTKWVRDDGSFILSTEDIHRRRMVMVSLFAFLMTAGYTALQVHQLGVQTTNWLNLGTGIMGCLFAVVALKVSLWSAKPRPYIRFLLLGFSLLLWVEIYQSGGVTGYHIGILPILPVVAAILLNTRDTVFFTLLNIVIVFGIGYVAVSTNHLPIFEISYQSDVLLSSFIIMISTLGCGAAAIMLVQQSEKVNRQLLDLVEYQSHLAAHDHLSGLANRIRLQERFERVQNGESFDILLIDLDGFKLVNDTHGHNAGDFLIKKLSERLREVTDENDLLVRLGGDEFVILLEEVDGTLGSVRKYAEYLIDIISRPYRWNQTVLRVSASIGHARYPNHGGTPSKVLSLADKALYQAKDAGKRQCITYGTKACPKSKRLVQPSGQRPETKRKIAAFTANLRQKTG